VVRHPGIEKDPGWSVRAVSDGWVVSAIDAAGPAADRISPGDGLLALNSDQRSAIVGIAFWTAIEAGSTYRVDLDRAGRRVTLELPMTVVRRRQLYPIIGFCGLIFFICGVATALARPADGRVRLAGAVLMLVASPTLAEMLGSERTFLEGWERTVYWLALILQVALFSAIYRFFGRFPAWNRPGRRWRAIEWTVDAIGWLVFVPAMGFVNLAWGPLPFVADSQIDFITRHPRTYLLAARLTAAPWSLYGTICLSIATIAAARNYRTQADPDSRRRIRWVIAAAVFSLVPFIALTIAYRVTGWMSMATFQLVNPLGFVAMLTIPAAFWMAIWKEQLFDIRVVVRRGLQYLFARTALRTLLVLPMALLLISILKNPNRTVAQILTEGAGWVNIVLLGAIAAALQSRQRLHAALDRRFFREAHEQEQVLARLMDEVRQLDSLADIARLVSARIDSVIHPTSIHVFYRAQAHSDVFESDSSSASMIGQQLAQQVTLLRLIEGATTIRDYPADFGLLPAHERGWLEALGVRIVAPITGTHDRLVGVLLLGERKSDEPYSATDRRLLEGIAGQIGVVYENQHLQARVRKDADVRRDVLARLGERNVSLLKECPACGACYDDPAERCDCDGAELALTLPIERTLEGKYRLDRAIGRGGFGTVFEAMDLRLQRHVAAKVMMGSLFGNPTALRRFEREARAAAKIDHRNITRVHDYGAVGSGGAYLIMELVGGRTWRAELQRFGVIAPRRAAAWFGQLLDALSFAHGSGVIHRDLKPENVMITETSSGEDLKIMDFGLAKVRDAGGATQTVTATGVAVGTLGYMAPELLEGLPVDGRADLFAVGVMTVETITGTRPFQGNTPQEVVSALLRHDYHLPVTSPELRALDAILQRCLATDPRDRYGTAEQLARDLIPTLAACAFGAAQPRPDAGDDTIGEGVVTQ